MAALGIGEKFLLAIFAFYVTNRIFGCQLAFATVLLGIVILLIKAYRAQTVWKRLGVPSPSSIILIGNVRDFVKKGMHNCDVEWMQKYGNLYGSYFFHMPELVITDKELLKQVLVKDFYNFTNRREFVSGNKKSAFQRMLTILRDDEWKNTRNAITPAFTSGKLKNTVHLMEKCINTCCEILDEQKENTEGIEIKTLMSNLTLEIIAAAAFAFETDSQRNPDNEFVKHCKQLSNFSFTDWRLAMAVLFPWTVTKLDEYFDIQVVFPGLEKFYVGNLTKVLKERRQFPKTDKLDFLQLMINAADNKDDHTTEMDTAIQHDVQVTKKWHLTDLDIIAQSFIFLLAGQETTANTLNFVLYLIAVHKEVQEKCFEEIQALTPNREPITYKNMQYGTPYLEAVISETMRLYPAAVRFDRHCENEYRLTDQLTIPKGAVVVVPVYAIQHDADNYEDPEKFIPDRFLDGQKSDDPFIYLPFGYGPRNCIGMRFAMLEMKLIVSNLIRKFHIEPTATTEPMPPELDLSTSALKPKKPFHLIFKRREN